MTGYQSHMESMMSIKIMVFNLYMQFYACRFHKLVKRLQENDPSPVD